MRLIIEGPDGVGKTTLVNALARHFKCDILHLIGEGSKDFDDYWAKANLRNVVSDRCFLSEIVYAAAFDRHCALTSYDCDRLMTSHKGIGWKFLILDAPTEVLEERLRVRGDENPNVIKKCAELRILYRGFAKFYDLPVIDVTTTSVDDIIRMLEEDDDVLF